MKWLVGRSTRRAATSCRGAAEEWVKFWCSPSLSIALQSSDSFSSPYHLIFLPCELKIRTLPSSKRTNCCCCWEIQKDLILESMEKESREQRGPPVEVASLEPDFPLQWGGRKRLRRVKIRNGGSAVRTTGRRRIATRIGRRVVVGGDRDFALPPLHYPAQLPLRRSESAGSENQKSLSMSPEKDDRCYTTRASVAPGCECENGAVGGVGVVIDDRSSTALPRFFVSLSNKEKEEDFLAMKGCKLPQRPKKRSKYIQKCILLVSPGGWLSDLSQERYVVREKKGSRKRRRGLKAMSMESDSE